MPFFVRINSLSSAEASLDLQAVVDAGPAGIVLPKAKGPLSVADLDSRLANLGDHRILILPIATETPEAVFSLGSYGGVSDRLCGLTWGAEDLPASMGAISREDSGRFTSPYEVVRALTLFGAHAAGVPAIETVYPSFRDESGLAAYAARGRRDGFSGMMAIHPNQVPIINEAFSPTREEMAWARKVIALFRDNPGKSVFSLEGKMIDAPHLKLAKHLLTMADGESDAQG
jgi:citrate lyase subunit beta/citryl-CoA lyase